MNDEVDNLLLLCVKELVFRCLTLAVPFFSRLSSWKYVGRTHDRRESCKCRPK